MAPKFEFEVNTTRYQPQNAFWLAKCAEIAYWTLPGASAPDEPRILGELKSWNAKFTAVKGFDNKSSQAFVARHEDMVIVAFRGTDEFDDWLDNLNLPAISRPLGRVHRGFQRALMDIWPDMLKVIENFKDNGQSLWITGHSLGGAMATLAAAERIDADRPFHGVYTFGQPRSGDQNFARFFNIEAKSRYFRFQNNNDVVARIPQRVMGYSHVGTFIYIDVDKNLMTDITWWYRFVDRIKGDWEGLRKDGLDWFEDHKMANYVAAIEKNLGRRPEGL